MMPPYPDMQERYFNIDEQTDSRSLQQLKYLIPDLPGMFGRHQEILIFTHFSGRP